MKCEFKSRFKNEIIGTVAKKQALGLSYKEGAKNLKRFDKFCITHFPQETILSKEIVLAWINGSISKHQHHNRIATVRQLANYMNSIGKEAFVIPFQTAPIFPKYELKSQFKDVIIGIVAKKQALGYCYKNNKRLFDKFDEFCFTRFPKETVLTKEIVMGWLEMQQSENVNTHTDKVSAMRQLAIYMNSLGENAFVVPLEFMLKQTKYIPHVYTKNELLALFSVMDHFEFYHKSPVRHLVIPVIFRMIYCCGLRPLEACNLLAKDVDLTSGAIKIAESKGHKDRIVVLADDMLSLCRKYCQQVKKIFPECPYFFPNKYGNDHVGRGWLDRICLQCWKKTGISDFNGKQHRVYDFRHTFATNRLYRWMQEGKDLMACLPILSAYMGHAHFSFTAYYIHLVPEFFPQMTQMNIGQFESLLPEVES